ncbi:MAG: hypothetical protein GY822_29875, partial [Deltaproteobacteria bacterium]|nr:hypothetical protein [Deltaproteobacteria bacterium]
MILLIRLALSGALLFAVACDDTPAPNGDVFGVVTNGKTKQWNEADVADIRQDLSGAAIDTHIVYV